MNKLMYAVELSQIILTFQKYIKNNFDCVIQYKEIKFNKV